MRKLITILITSLFLFSTPTQAEEIADGPYMYMGVLVGSMMSCVFLTPDDNSGADSHCNYGVYGSVAGSLAFQNTSAKKWAGAATGCTLGALKEIADHNKWTGENAVADEKDFYWTCGPAITTQIGMNGIIAFYNKKEIEKFAGDTPRVNQFVGLSITTEDLGNALGL